MKKILLTLLQLTVTSAVLYWVFHDPGVRTKMMRALRDANWGWNVWIAAAIGAYLLVELAAALRWHVLLKVQGIRLSAPRVGALFMIGMFFNQFLPGGTGGDIVKSYLLIKETPGKITGALLAVLFDRVIGLVALISITGTLIALRYDFLARTSQTRALLWTLLGILGFSVLGLITTFVISGFDLAKRLPVRFPGREKLIETSAAYHLYAHHWGATAAAFGCSLVAHLATFSMFLCVARALGFAFATVDFFAIMPIERTISSLPISFGGAGLREKILGVMLHDLLGADAGVAALIGTLGYVVMLTCAAPGGLIYLLYQPSGAVGHVKLSEMREEVATLEHGLGEG